MFHKKLPFKRVLMDSWYATQRLMALIDNWEKIYYCPLKKNRLVDETGGNEKYQRIDSLSWSELDVKQGKLIKLKKFPDQKKVKWFRVTISTNRTEYIATNELTASDIEQVKSTCSYRWKIEEFHRELKQAMQRGLGEAARSWGSPPETKPVYCGAFIVSRLCRKGLNIC
ncbi:MAG: transposase [Moorea sp. SIO3I7]|nr:transposase [Moorena sp. SIO3I7]NEO65898.1 transposase [Moorena sp. SIO4G2]